MSVQGAHASACGGPCLQHSEAESQASHHVGMDPKLMSLREQPELLAVGQFSASLLYFESGLTVAALTALEHTASPILAHTQLSLCSVRDRVVL